VFPALDGLAAYARGVSVVPSAVVGVQDCTNASDLPHESDARALGFVRIELTDSAVCETRTNMQNDDVCLTSVATFDRLAERYAEKYFHLGLYERYLEGSPRASSRTVEA
jgi:hypothetical protein